MSFIKIALHTMPDGIVSIKTKSECTMLELESAARYLISEVIAASGTKVVEEMLKRLIDERTASTE